MNLFYFANITTKFDFFSPDSDHEDSPVSESEEEDEGAGTSSDEEVRCPD